MRNAYALDAVRDTGGNVVCNITLTNPSLGQGCVPLNVFGPTAANAAALDYVRDGFAMSDSPLGRFYLAGVNIKS